MKERVQSAEEMEAFAQRFCATLAKGERARTLCLKGDLGAGKTAFVKGAAKYFGVDEHVTSPTFVIEKIYELQNAVFKHLIHIDAYRLSGAHELSALGFEAVLRDPENLVLLEWPERVTEALPEDARILEFSWIDESARDVSWQES